jgi:hypothetical protein
MENNTFTFWASKNQVPFIQKQFEHRDNLTVLEGEEDNCIKLELRVTHGADLYYLFCAGVEWISGAKQSISKA